MQIVFAAIFQKGKVILKLVFKLLISSFLLLWFLSRVTFSELLNQLSLISFPVFLFVFALGIIAVIINTIKWKSFIKSYRLLKLIVYNYLSMFYSLFLPGSQFAGETVKVYKLGKIKRNSETIAASVIMDRVTGLIALLLVGFLGILASNNSVANSLLPWYSFSLLFLIILLSVFAIPSLNGIIQTRLSRINTFPVMNTKVLSWIQNFIEIWHRFIRQPRLILQAVFIGIIFQLISVYTTYFLAESIGVHIPYSDWCWIMGIVFLLMFLPVSIGGIGVREGSLVVLLGMFGVANEKALSLSLVMFALQIINGLIGGAVFYAVKNRV